MLRSKSIQFSQKCSCLVDKDTIQSEHQRVNPGSGGGGGCCGKGQVGIWEIREFREIGEIVVKLFSVQKK